MRVIFALLLLFLPATAFAQGAEKAIVALSQNRVSITASFSGSEILVFGAVARETPAPSDPELDVIVEIIGPTAPVTVRKKERVMGIWVNNESLTLDSAPMFHAIATTGPMEDILTEHDALLYRIGLNHIVTLQDGDESVLDTPLFRRAAIRIRNDQGLYRDFSETVNLAAETLFSTHFTLPANLVEGDYRARVFLTRGGRVIDSHETVLPVRKVGLELWVYRLAFDYPLAYGGLTLLISLSFGWGASALFRKLRGG